MYNGLGVTLVCETVGDIYGGGRDLCRNQCGRKYAGVLIGKTRVEETYTRKETATTIKVTKGKLARKNMRKLRSRNLILR